MPSAHEVTCLLQAWCGGDQAALDKLVPLVYDDALTALAAIDPREAKVVSCVFSADWAWKRPRRSCNF